MGLTRCTCCVMISTWPGISFNEQGVCSLCLAYDEYVGIDWVEQEKRLREILESYKKYAIARGNKYDCILPSSGGKDSTWALYVLKILYNMTPLVVTWNHGLWMSPEATYNLHSIPANLDCDHIDFRLGNGLRNGIARKATIVGGDWCGFCHLGVGSLPARIAKQWEVPLVVYGEPTALYSTTGHYRLQDLEENDKTHFEDVFQGVFSPEKIVPPGYAFRDMLPMTWPKGEFQLKSIYLGNFLRWDQWEQVAIITEKLGWRHIQLPITYTDWDKVDCERGECLREVQKFHRRRISRVAFQASKDIREGLLTREEALELVERYESRIPNLEVSGVLNELGFASKEELLELTRNGGK